ncbi:MAG: hypothetical protein LC101_04405 [Flavobacteriales bacterium]|nr:hypothetical protein [Flavobacteriales bacterium]
MERPYRRREPDNGTEGSQSCGGCLQSHTQSCLSGPPLPGDNTSGSSAGVIKWQNLHRCGIHGAVHLCLRSSVSHLEGSFEDPGCVWTLRSLR